MKMVNIQEMMKVLWILGRLQLQKDSEICLDKNYIVKYIIINTINNVF